MLFAMEACYAHCARGRFFSLLNIWELALREKCPNTEFFLVRMQENTDQKKLRIWTLFMQGWESEIFREFLKIIKVFKNINSGI